MASTFLTLTNKLLRRTGDTVIETADFATARNVQALAKDSINAAIAQINQSGVQWPFNYTRTTQTLATDGTREYDLPVTAMQVDWHSFYRRRDGTNNIPPRKLKYLDWDDYQQRYRDADENRLTADDYSVPEFIYRTHDSKFGITPTSKYALVIEYAYWNTPAELSAATDATTIPTQFDHVIVDGAFFYMMQHRSNPEVNDRNEKKFAQGLRDMKNLLVGRSEYVRGTMIDRQSSDVTPSVYA